MSAIEIRFKMDCNRNDYNLEMIKNDRMRKKSLVLLLFEQSFVCFTQSFVLHGPDSQNGNFSHCLLQLNAPKVA